MQDTLVILFLTCGFTSLQGILQLAYFKLFSGLTLSAFKNNNKHDVNKIRDDVFDQLLVLFRSSRNVIGHATGTTKPDFPIVKGYLNLSWQEVIFYYMPLIWTVPHCCMSNGLNELR